jgi:hypothetical protein
VFDREHEERMFVGAWAPSYTFPGLAEGVMLNEITVILNKQYVTVLHREVWDLGRKTSFSGPSSAKQIEPGFSGR